MPQINCIKEALAPSHWNEARRDFFARFLVALLTAQTACLYRLASLLPTPKGTVMVVKPLSTFSDYNGPGNIDTLTGGNTLDQQDEKTSYRLLQGAGRAGRLEGRKDHRPDRLGEWHPPQPDQRLESRCLEGVAEPL